METPRIDNGTYGNVWNDGLSDWCSETDSRKNRREKKSEGLHVVVEACRCSAWALSWLFDRRREVIAGLRMSIGPDETDLKYPHGL